MAGTIPSRIISEEQWWASLNIKTTRFVLPINDSTGTQMFYIDKVIKINLPFRLSFNHSTVIPIGVANLEPSDHLNSCLSPVFVLLCVHSIDAILPSYSQNILSDKPDKCLMSKSEVTCEYKGYEARLGLLSGQTSTDR